MNEEFAWEGDQKAHMAHRNGFFDSPYNLRPDRGMHLNLLIVLIINSSNIWRNIADRVLITIPPSYTV